VTAARNQFHDKGSTREADAHSRGTEAEFQEASSPSRVTDRLAPNSQSRRITDVQPPTGESFIYRPGRMRLGQIGIRSPGGIYVPGGLGGVSVFGADEFSGHGVAGVAEIVMVLAAVVKVAPAVLAAAIIAAWTSSTGSAERKRSPRSHTHADTTKKRKRGRVGGQVVGPATHSCSGKQWSWRDLHRTKWRATMFGW